MHQTSGNKKPGYSKHPLYKAWAGMVNRCTNPNNSHYHLYGGAGVRVCERWRTFKNFLDDMGERPEGKSLDRIDPLGDYEPSNCRWATASEQRNNYSESGDQRQREGARAGALRRWSLTLIELEGTTIFPKNNESPVRFHFLEEDDRALNALNGYIVCPADLFTREQLDRALRRYRKKKSHHAPDWQKDAANVR